jgi:hypothetical protein
MAAHPTRASGSIREWFPTLDNRGRKKEFRDENQIVHPIILVRHIEQIRIVIRRDSFYHGGIGAIRYLISQAFAIFTFEFILLPATLAIEVCDGFISFKLSKMLSSTDRAKHICPHPGFRNNPGSLRGAMIAFRYVFVQM